MASLSSSAAQRQYHCVDDATIRNLVERVSSEERAHVLNTLSSTYTDSLNSVGFCKKRPVQILSPFEIEPGPLRRKWLEAFAECEANGDFKNMPYLVYWFESSLRSGTPFITLEPWDSFLSCKAGERLNYDRIPKEIEKKIRAKQELTAGEQLMCDALDAFEAARERRLPPSTMKRDEELYMVVKIGKKPGNSGSTAKHGAGDKKKEHSKLSSDIKTPKQFGVGSAEKQSHKNGSNKRGGLPNVSHEVIQAKKLKQASPGAKSEISDELAAFLGQGKMMPRTAIVHHIWEYIHKHKLQNPFDKREIILDRAMRNVFGCKKFTMFTVNKYIGAHIYPFTPVVLSSLEPSVKKRKAKASNGPKKKKPTQPPYRLSDELQAIVGADILPRPQVVSKLIKYVKVNNLQNPCDGREILCDTKLKRVMKESKVTFFSMQKHIGEHLLEQLDRSAYRHEKASDSKESDNDEG